MSSRGSGWTLILLVLASAMVAVGCGGDGTDGPIEPSPEPTTGTLEVSASTTGETPDADGYTATLDGGAGQSLDPDGTVTFTDVSEGGREVALSELQVNCDPDGSNPRTVSVTAGETTTTTFDVVCPKALLEKIAFHSDREAGLFEIYFMETDGSSLTRLTNDPSMDFRPAISPDGTTIAFQSDRGDGGDIDIWTIQADGTGLQQVTSDPASDRAPAWSPDGDRIAFESNREGNTDIWTIDPDGTDPQRVTDDPGGDFSPAWSPDGDRIAFYSDRGGPWQIFTINPDGTGEVNLTDTSASDGDPYWGPGR